MGMQHFHIRETQPVTRCTDIRQRRVRISEKIKEIQFRFLRYNQSNMIMSHHICISPIQRTDVCFQSDISYVRHFRTAVNDSTANVYVCDFYSTYFEGSFVIADQNIKL